MGQRQGDGREAPRGIYYGWLVVATVALLLAVSSGGRFLFGVVLKPVSEEFGWSRGQLASAVTINVFFLTLLQPVVGWAADRWGSRRVLLVGVAATALMTLPLTFATHLWQVYLLYGALASLAFAATSPVNTTKLISGWFVKRRALALSIGTSGAAFGQLAIVPLATWIMVTWTWRASYWTLAAVALLVLLPLGFFVVRDAPADAAESAVGSRQWLRNGGRPPLPTPDSRLPTPSRCGRRCARRPTGSSPSASSSAASP